MKTTESLTPTEAPGQLVLNANYTTPITHYLGKETPFSSFSTGVLQLWSTGIGGTTIATDLGAISQTKQVMKGHLNTANTHRILLLIPGAVEQ